MIEKVRKFEVILVLNIPVILGDKCHVSASIWLVRDSTGEKRSAKKEGTFFCSKDSIEVVKDTLNLMADELIPNKLIFPPVSILNPNC